MDKLLLPSNEKFLRLYKTGKSYQKNSDLYLFEINHKFSHDKKHDDKKHDDKKHDDNKHDDKKHDDKKYDDKKHQIDNQDNEDSKKIEQNEDSKKIEHNEEKKDDKNVYINCRLINSDNEVIEWENPDINSDQSKNNSEIFNFFKTVLFTVLKYSD
jgi:hypothetical protein